MRWSSLLGDRLAKTSGYRPEIQALRAVAVLMVMLYHLWPTHLVGGFAGVDVFFVISGFLITQHLWNSAAAGRLSLSGFYARRVRRLAPASMFVLIAVLVATALIVPFGQWKAYTAEIIGSALLVQNWVLAHNSVDYLAADNTPSPVQHYWSLSVEEQFYLVWPLLILIVAVLLRRSAVRTRARATLGVLGVMFVGSLVFSVIYTHANPAPAYFVTPGRVWQFAAGGMLALATPAGLIGVRERSPAAARAAAVASWLGFGAIVAVAFLLNAHSVAYPSAWGLLPVIPTMIVIWAGSGDRVGWSPHRVYDLAPVQFLGTVSYPIYLWHWPLIVLTPYLVGDLHVRMKLAIGVVTIILSALTTLLIENPIRFSPALSARRLMAPIGAAGVSCLLIVAPSLVLASQASAKFAAQKVAVSQKIADGASCFGAHAMENKAQCDPVQGQVSEAAVSASGSDEPQPFRDKCIDPLTRHKGVYCDYGDTSKPPTVMLWGDSHAAAWGGAFDEAGKEGGIHVVVGSRQGCPATETAPIATVFRSISAKEQGDCDAHNQQMLDMVRNTKSIKMVVLASYSTDYVYGPNKKSPSYWSGTTKLIADLHALGVKIRLLGDVPLTGSDSAHRVDGPTCLAKNLDHPEKCANKRAVALNTRALRNAIAKSPVKNFVRVIDTSAEFCDATECPMLIGSVPVFFDASHITDTYSRTMGPWVLRHVLKT